VIHEQAAPINELAIVSSSDEIAPLTSRVDTERLVRIFLSNKSERTIGAYKKDLADFAKFQGIEDGDLDNSARRFLSAGRGGANAIAAEYREHLESRQLSPATINRRLSALRSMVEQAATLGLINWELKIKGPKSRSYRDTAGPGTPNVRRMLGLVHARQDAKGLRDFAILRLLYDLALRRGEVVSLDLDDLDLESSILKILGKGRTEKEILKVPQPTVEALHAWLEVRGTDAGPLFTNFDRAGKGSRLTGTAVYLIVRKLGQELGIKTRPHGIRHASISACVAQFPLTDVQRFSRHKKLETVAIYVDQLDGGVQSKIADFVSRTA
jgi:integrase/recombinase XerC